MALYAIWKEDIGIMGTIVFQKAEATAVHSLIKPSPRKCAVHRFRVCFFGSFLHKQKRTLKMLRNRIISDCGEA